MNEIKTTRAFFNFLNSKCDYLVLRNWDDIFNDSIYGNGHEDIDILCRDIDAFIKLTKAKRVHHSNYRDNFVVKVGNMNIRFDVRHVGDGYYPIKWEKSMLNRKIYTDQNIYVMNIEDYAYSLSYHALIQKPSLSKEYQKKIIDVFHNLGDTDASLHENNILELLQNYCLRNDYNIEIPSDPGVYLNFQNMSKFKCSKNFIRRIRRVNFRLTQSILNRVSILKNKILSVLR